MLMRRMSVAFVATMVIALLPVTVADARRVATTSQKRAIAGKHRRCWRVYVSSVDARYASLEFNAKAYKSAECAPLASNGIDIYRRRDGRWRHVSGMSDCPSRLPGVPAAVYRDLTRAYCR